jgi:hypothetical protein
LFAKEERGTSLSLSKVSRGASSHHPFCPSLENKHTHRQSLSLSLSLREKLNRLVCSVWFFGRNWLCQFQRKKERKGGDLGFVSRKEEEEEGDLGVAAAWVGLGGGRQRKEER